MDHRAAREEASDLVARYVELTGIVQGVGFRPFVYNLALGHGLRGCVRNTSVSVQVYVEGAPAQVDAFVGELRSKAPPLAQIERVTVQPCAPRGAEWFVIEESLPQPGAYQLVSPDIATCADCRRELFDPQDRRYGYPFINCTNCGPRFTIIEDIPYDGPNTTMRDFPMCPRCRAEYEDPANRRFHAQPNACPVCGPHLQLIDRTGAPLQQAQQSAEGGDLAMIREAVRLLKEGRILAIKGLGGYQLACDGRNEEAVCLLRSRKKRPAKPFALMIESVGEIRRRCQVSDSEEGLLTSPAAPIVLLRQKLPTDIAPGVAPQNNYLGVMLPCTPLHHLLMREADRPLVMTSGNLSEEPICSQNDEALQRLGHLADAFLVHNRGIHSRYDDSVWMVPASVGPQPIRRARGYAPNPVRLNGPMPRVLALGAELKNTFCLTRDHYAFVSQHIGDLENLETLMHLTATIELYERLFRFTPEVVACDLHPDYLATQYAQERAREQGLPLIPVQHHLAHIASCLADNNWPADGPPVIGVALDGTGLGGDGRIWGGEFLIADCHSARRFGHLEYLPLPGGDSATRKPYRIALAYLQALLGEVPHVPALEAVPREELENIQRMVAGSVNTPLTSSCGRLFDAVSALLGVCSATSYDAQAAIELEMAVGDIDAAQVAPYAFGLDTTPEGGMLRLQPLFQGLIADLLAGVGVPTMSARFHRTVSAMVTAMASLIREQHQVDTVALSGGCFQNRLLLRLCVESLRAERFDVLVQHQVPSNDGGISLGQAIVAGLRMAGASRQKRVL
ncbi:MAG TPA: carbamoyltransferase HypF [Anaerolineae bacterium]|nr:carbamoyltransferase HypF [Anaerolineae bacterium]